METPQFLPWRMSLPTQLCQSSECAGLQKRSAEPGVPERVCACRRSCPGTTWVKHLWVVP